MKRFLLLFCCVLVSLFQLFADDLSVWTEEFYPYNFLKGDGSIAGVSSDIVYELLERSGLDYTIQLVPWARAFSLTSSKANNMVYSIMRTKEREELFRWIGPIMTASVSLLGRTAQPFYAGPGEFRRFRFAVNRGDAAREALLLYGVPEGHIQEVDGKSALFKMLKSFRVDFIAYDTRALELYMKESDPVVENMHLIYTFPEKELFLGFHPETDQYIIQRCQKVWEEMLSDGSRDRIVDSFYQKQRIIDRP